MGEYKNIDLRESHKEYDLNEPKLIWLILFSFIECHIPSDIILLVTIFVVIVV